MHTCVSAQRCWNYQHQHLSLHPSATFWLTQGALLASPTLPPFTGAPWALPSLNLTGYRRGLPLPAVSFLIPQVISIKKCCGKRPTGCPREHHWHGGLAAAEGVMNAMKAPAPFSDDVLQALLCRAQSGHEAGGAGCHARGRKRLVEWLIAAFDEKSSR